MFYMQVYVCAISHENGYWPGFAAYTSVATVQTGHVIKRTGHILSELDTNVAHGYIHRYRMLLFLVTKTFEHVSVDYCPTNEKQFIEHCV